MLNGFKPSISTGHLEGMKNKIKGLKTKVNGSRNIGFF
ncbi:hypothetical protein ACT29H_02505 [Thermophagus sp. OGC60D27]